MCCGRQEPLLRAAGASRCVVRLEPLRRAAGRTAVGGRAGDAALGAPGGRSSRMIGLQDPPTSGITSGPCCAMAMATDVNDWQRCSWARRRESRATAQSCRQELFCRVAGAVAPGGRSWCAWRHCCVQWARQRSEPLCLAVGADATDGWTHCAVRQEPMRWAVGAAAVGGTSPRRAAGDSGPGGRSLRATRKELGGRSCSGRLAPGAAK